MFERLFFSSHVPACVYTLSLFLVTLRRFSRGDLLELRCLTLTAVCGIVQSRVLVDAVKQILICYIFSLRGKSIGEQGIEGRIFYTCAVVNAFDVCVKCCRDQPSGFVLVSCLAYLVGVDPTGFVLLRDDSEPDIENVGPQPDPAETQGSPDTMQSDSDIVSPNYAMMKGTGQMPHRFDKAQSGEIFLVTLRRFSRGDLLELRCLTLTAVCGIVQSRVLVDAVKQILICYIFSLRGKSIGEQGIEDLTYTITNIPKMANTSALFFAALFLLAVASPARGAGIFLNGLTVNGQLCCTSTGNCPGQGVDGVPVVLNCTNIFGSTTTAGRTTTTDTGSFKFTIPLVGLIFGNIIPCTVGVLSSAALSATTGTLSTVQSVGTVVTGVLGLLQNATITGFSHLGV
ncbi:hypothetical protein SASPL_117823 [Salvia splendens]|uniref:Uncharacterized protein n=1 Tax=Salvia splendens TaxID=180675 RepID=A0A8X8ZY54_SALSN|nr:hypothetical protein SASPL_117823 [Salvia splendens]